jgi:predicted transcriptional regulator
MRRSKLEICVDVLNILALNGPLKKTHLSYKTNLNCCALHEQLDFLASNTLIEERTIKKNPKSLKKGTTVYAITQRGQNILRSFRELNALLPIEENAKCFF